EHSSRASERATDAVGPWRTAPRRRVPPGPHPTFGTRGAERTMTPTSTPKIVWTKGDEAPALATYSLLPIVETFATAAGVAVETRDISLAGRILAKFPVRLRDDQRVNDDLAYLGELVTK